jgi:hypothetical protein
MILDLKSLVRLSKATFLLLLLLLLLSFIYLFIYLLLGGKAVWNNFDSSHAVL